MVNASLYYSWCKGAIAILQSAKILYIYTGKSQLKTYRYGIITGKEWIKLPVQKRRLCWRFLGNTVLNDAEGTTNNNTSWFTFWKWKIHLWNTQKNYVLGSRSQLQEKFPEPPQNRLRNPGCPYLPSKSSQELECALPSMGSLPGTKLRFLKMVDTAMARRPRASWLSVTRLRLAWSGW